MFRPESAQTGNDQPQEKTPLERDMETFVRLMRDLGAEPEEIREGLKARMGVPAQEEKNAPSRSARGATRTPPHTGVPESESSFGKES